MEVLIFVILAVVILVIVGVVQGGEIARVEQELRGEFPGAKVYVSTADRSFLVVDFAQKQVVVGLKKPRGTFLAQEEPYRAQIAFARIIKVEVVSDDTQIASTNRGSQALGATAGALVLGGLGAVIGGLSGSSTTLSGTRRLSLRVTVDDTSKPLHEVTFFETQSKKGGRRGQLLFDQSAKRIAEFGAHLDAAVRRTENTDPNSDTESLSSPSSMNTISKEIGELWKLKESGALTDEEFETQKARLLKG